MSGQMRMQSSEMADFLMLPVTNVTNLNNDRLESCRLWEIIYASFLSAVSEFGNIGNW